MVRQVSEDSGNTLRSAESVVIHQRHKLGLLTSHQPPDYKFPNLRELIIFLSIFFFTCYHL